MRADWTHVALLYGMLLVVSLAFPGCEALRGLQDESAKNFWENTNRQVGGGVQ